MSDELTDEQKLEAAKKKYEALKKKSKKKNKKSKKTDVEGEEKSDDVKEVSEEPEEIQEDVSVEKDEPMLKEVEEEIKEESMEEVKEEETEEEVREEVKEEVKEEAEEEKVIEEAETVEEAEKEPVEEPEKESIESIETSEETDKSNVDEISAKLEQTALDEDELLGDEPVVESTTDVCKEPAQETTKEVDSLFPESNQSFLETLKTPEPVSVSDDSNQINQLLKENEALKSEVKSLKLLKLDHLEQIETLQERVQNLENKLQRQSLNVPQSNYQQPLSGYDEDNFTLSPTPSYQQPHYFEQQQHFHSNLSNEINLEEVQTNLHKFKGWNVNMMNWRSIGEGLIVKL